MKPSCSRALISGFSVYAAYAQVIGEFGPDRYRVVRLKSDQRARLVQCLRPIDPDFIQFINVNSATRTWRFTWLGEAIVILSMPCPPLDSPAIDAASARIFSARPASDTMPFSTTFPLTESAETRSPAQPVLTSSGRRHVKLDTYWRVQQNVIAIIDRVENGLTRRLCTDVNEGGRLELDIRDTWIGDEDGCRGRSQVNQCAFSYFKNDRRSIGSYLTRGSIV